MVVTPVTTAKIPTASVISRLLRRAGFERAVIKTQGGKAGFAVSAYYGTGGVRVEHYTNTMSTSGGHSEVKLDAYARAITEAGYDVSRQSPRWLLVTAKEGD
jgi:hypothetical protein